MQAHPQQPDLDPAAPRRVANTRDLVRAIQLANFGEGGSQTFPVEMTAAPPTLQIDWSSVQAFLDACRAAGVVYGLGEKVPGDTAVPGIDFKAVDCSGFVQAAIRRSTNPIIPFPDGSVVQQDWVKARGFAQGSVGDGKLQDGKVRIAFLSPHDSPEGIGHVVLIHNGETAESHGGVGPDSRPFDGSGWQVKATVYLLTN